MRTIIGNLKSRIHRACKKIIRELNNLSYPLLFSLYSFINMRAGMIQHHKEDKSNIIIVGGELYNKGAQAMTFTMVDQLRTIYPDKNICLFSALDYKRSNMEKSKYNFHIIPWNTEAGRSILGISIKRIILIRSSENKKDEVEIKDIIRNAAFFVDISGYALSSQWGWLPILRYLNNIAVAKLYNIPYIILPQSLGPFKFSILNKIWLFPLLKMYLKYPQKIYAREKEGIEEVKRLSKSNIEYAHDIVLQHKEYNLANIYSQSIQFKTINIEHHSVGIIPNQRVVERDYNDNLLQVYSVIVSTLLDSGKTIYILRHSYEDLDICREIKAMFLDNDKVILISDDLNAIELDCLIKQFDFVIASRYHSVVHAYKNGIPAIVIGWATKYRELLENFGQLEYFFDCRENVEVVRVIGGVINMIARYRQERNAIQCKMTEIMGSKTVFSLMKELIRDTGV